MSGTFGEPSWPTRNVTVADLDGDQRPEIIVANRYSWEQPGANYICANDGHGAFPDCRVLSTEPATTIASSSYSETTWLVRSAAATSSPKPSSEV